MRLTEWFHEQLLSSNSQLNWAALQVPAERRLLQPPDGLGEWNATRHVFHMLYYEKTMVLDVMRQWQGQPAPDLGNYDEDAAWAANSINLESLLAQLTLQREAQVALIGQLTEADWERTLRTEWGPVTLRWVVSKTWQHTAEHISDLMRIALFWNHYVADQGTEG